MSDFSNRANTIPMETASKMTLFRQNHPIVRELRQIVEIREHDEDWVGQRDCLSLKELFLKENMDRYHVDCLILRKIARNVLEIMKKLMDRKIYPGLLDLEDVIVDFRDTSLPVCLFHPEKFQLLKMEQDYEWYPEDERLFGELVLFDEKSQLLAYNRFLYKILVASTKGNVKVPPRATTQDYSSIFYGTLPESWKLLFEHGESYSLAQWSRELDDAIEAEEAYERRMKVAQQQDLAGEDPLPVPVEKEVECLFVLLRTDCESAFALSRILYEEQDRLEVEQDLTKSHFYQTFVYGDGVIYQKERKEYPKNYRVQMKQNIQKYPLVETLLIACDLMQELSLDDAREYRMYILCDGRIENNAMYQICLSKIEDLHQLGVQIHLLLTGDCQCEAWDRMKRGIEQG